ncbi:twin-arginine translocase subunit TatB, partial [Mesorhizobium sp. M7A.F.Ca.CA.004.12.1.1]
FNEALKEAELDDVKKSVDELRGMSPMAEIRKQLNPFEQAAADVRSGVDAAMKPKPAADPASSVASTPQTAEPLKNGATTMPGVNAPEAAPAAPVFPAMTDESVVTSSAPAEPVAAPKASAAKKPAKPAPAKATPAAKASANGAKVAAKAASASKTQAKAMTTAQPEAPSAKTPAAANAVAAKT